MRDSLSRGW
jgi:hypothetical protein